MYVHGLIRWVLVVVVAAVVVGAGTGGCSRRAEEKASIAVLAATRPAQVIGVDVAGRRVVSRTRLSDFAFAGCVDASSAANVTAISGGPGDDAGDTVAILARGTRSPRYRTTIARNPTDVAVADGAVVTIHGLLVGGRLVVGSFDLQTGSRLATGSVEECTTQMETIDGRVLVYCSNSEKSRRDGRGGELLEIEPRTLRTRSVARPGIGAATPVRDPLSTATTPTVLLVGYDSDVAAGQSYGPGSQVVRVDLTTGDVVWRNPLEGLSQGAFGGAASRDTLAVLDSSLDDSAGSSGIALYDLSTGRLKARVRLGQPSDVVIVGDEVVVTDVATARLEYLSLDGERLGFTDLEDLGVTADIDLWPNGYLAR